MPLDNNDLTRKAYTLCRDPVRPKNTHAVPKCMDLIEVDHVVGAVMDYYDEKLLPPIGDPKKDYPEIEPTESADNEPEVIQPEPDVKAPSGYSDPESGDTACSCHWTNACTYP